MQTAVMSRQSSADESDDFFGYAIETNDTVVSDRVNVFSGNHRCTSLPGTSWISVLAVVRLCQSQQSKLGSQSRHPWMQSPCWAVRHMTLQIQTLLDHVLHLTWFGSIGFAAEAPRRSDPHAEMLANRKPLQQNDRLPERHCHSHTAVHANGAHVLWAIPPFGVAFHMDFMQDFLSNIATYWLWVDACQFDVDEDTSPSDFQRTRSLHRRPRCCTWADEVPMRTRFFQHLLGAGAPKQSSDTAIPSLKTRSSELS